MSTPRHGHSVASGLSDHMPASSPPSSSASTPLSALLSSSSSASSPAEVVSSSLSSLSPPAVSGSSSSSLLSSERRRALPHSVSANSLSLSRRGGGVDCSPSSSSASASSGSLTSSVSSSALSSYAHRPYSYVPRPPNSIAETLRERWRHFSVHKKHEWVLFKQNWALMLVAGIFQYFHGIATNVAHYMHVPREPLGDLGFALIPALSRQQQIVSEYMFFMVVGATILFVVSPYFCPHDPHVPSSKKRYTFVMLPRFLIVTVLAQTLRIICFLVTSLPGPNYHCRPDAPDYSPPRNLHDILFNMNPFTRCGDLVFSSHTIFVVLCALTWHKYSRIGLIEKTLMWALVGLFGLLVVAARKHYSLDVVVAIILVPLVWYVYAAEFPDKLPPELMSDDELFAEELDVLASSRCSDMRGSYVDSRASHDALHDVV